VQSAGKDYTKYHKHKNEEDILDPPTFSPLKMEGLYAFETQNIVLFHKEPSSRNRNNHNCITVNSATTN
jgi:hypothetical protein